jgi:anti-sigma B factor antagonist
MGDVVVIDLAGTMCLCGEDELPALVAHMLDQGFRRFVLNLLQVPYMDSSGLGGMLRAYTTVARSGGKLKLVHVHERIRRLLEIARLGSTLEVFTSEDAAVCSFGE